IWSGTRWSNSDAIDGPQQLNVFDAATGCHVGRLEVLPAAEGLPPFSCAAISYDGRLVAGLIEGETGVRVYETASGLLYRQFDGHRDRVLSAAFSPDGRTLATGGQDGVALIWNLRLPPHPQAKSAADLWVHLGSIDAAQAGDAVRAMGERPDAVRFLRERLKPVRPVPPEQVARLIDGLAAPAFADRERAELDLVALRDAAQPGL